MRIKKEETLALIIDIQEKLFPHIFDFSVFQNRVNRLITGLKILNIPILLTEQYSKGLGKTILPVKSLIPEINPYEKISFSCCEDSLVESKILQSGKKFVIAAGIEAHICVLQTVIDLIENGLIPVVVSDCVSSRKENDKLIALERMKNEGAIMTTYESLLMELCRRAGDDQFKAISATIK